MATGNRTDPWAHVQLDALGLFLVAYCTLAAAGHFPPDTALIGRFVRYLAAIGYWERPDLGHWEEWPALVRTSSVGCCVAGLRAAGQVLGAAGREVCEGGLDALADRGAAVLADRLGGPDTDAWEADGRGDDAALLTLLLPPIATRLRLSDAQRAALAAAALRLRRPHGVLRYAGDSYYGSDYQARLRAWKQEHAGGDPTAYPSPAVRNSWAVPGCEAQWSIFEPLLLLHFLDRHAAASAARALRSGSAGDLLQRPEPEAPPKPLSAPAASATEVRRSLMRMLAAIEEAAPAPGEVRLHVHESYCLVGDQRGPNDVQDLLWAVAYVRMALAALSAALAKGDAAPFT